MKLNFLVAPDFAPERFAGWHMLNALLQSRSGLHVHLMTPATAQEQADLLASGSVDVAYANPFDASSLMRTLGFRAMAVPVGKPDEMVIATAVDSPVRRVEDLQPGARIALTSNRDVKLIGLRLLEAADLRESDVQWVPVETYQAAARMAMKGEVDASFFLADTYHCLSKLTRSQMRVVIESAIHTITHVVLAHERIAPQVDALRQALTGVGQQPNDHEVLQTLGIPQGFAAMQQEDAEFMVDLMDTLLD